MSTVERRGLRLVVNNQADLLSGDAPAGIEDFGFPVPITRHPALVNLANIHRDVERSFRRIAACGAPSAELGCAALASWRSTALGTFAGVAALSIFANVLMLAMPIYVFQMVDHVLPGRDIDPLLLLPVLTLGLLAAMSMLDFLRRWPLIRLGTSMETVLGGAILSAMLMSDPEREGGHVQALRDMHKIRGFLSSAAVLLPFDVPLTPFFFGVVFLINPGLGAIVAIVCLVASGVAIFGRTNAAWIARTLAAIAIVSWSVHLTRDGTLTVGMMIAASIIAGRALHSLVAASEGWKYLLQTRAAYIRVRATLDGRQLPGTGAQPAPIPLPANVLPLRKSAAKRRHIAMSC